jgi:ribosomal protein S27E
MSYEAKITLKFDSTWDRKGGIYDDEIIPEEHITFECTVDDLNSIQLFQFFAKFAGAMGHNEAGIAKGAAYVAFNEMRSTEDMRKTAEEYDLKLVEDHIKTITIWEAEIRDLKAKLSRCQNPDNPNYTDEEMDAMAAECELENKELCKEYGVREEEFVKTPSIKTLMDADVVCHDCGKKYGVYSVGSSSTWVGECDVCGETKGVTETRDYGYLDKGIKEYNSK